MDGGTLPFQIADHAETGINDGGSPSSDHDAAQLGGFDTNTPRTARNDSILFFATVTEITGSNSDSLLTAPSVYLFSQSVVLLVRREGWPPSSL